MTSTTCRLRSSGSRSTLSSRMSAWMLSRRVSPFLSAPLSSLLGYLLHILTTQQGMLASAETIDTNAHALEPHTPPPIVIVPLTPPLPLFSLFLTPPP